MAPRLTVVDHPLVQEQLALVRDRRTGQVAFRKAVHRLGRLMAYEFLRGAETEEVVVQTPLGKARGRRVKGADTVVIVLVLRAAIPFVEGIYESIPLARTGVVSAWRGEAPDFSIEVRYSKVPRIGREETVIFADPMLATGHTLVEVARRTLKGRKPRRLAFFSLISTMLGIERVAEEFPSGEFYTCAVDPGLDSRGYIVPGLGDAGDRSFGAPQ